MQWGRYLPQLRWRLRRHPYHFVITFSSTLSGCAEARGAALQRPEKYSRTAVYAALFQAVAPCAASLDPNLTK